MADSFDPYLRWLGIRDPQRPPNHYRLLGLDLFENDSDVIAVAADRQMAHVRTFQTGQLAELSQRLLNELSAVRICLLKPEKKAAYDAQLKKQLGGAAVAARPKPRFATDSSTAVSGTGLPVAAGITEEISARAPSAGGADAETEEFPDFGSLASATGFDTSLATGKSSARKSAARSRRRKSLGPWIGLAAAGMLLVIGVVVVQSMNEPAPPVAMADGAKRTAPEAASNKGPTPVKAGSKEPGAGSKPRGAESGERGAESKEQGTRVGSQGAGVGSHGAGEKIAPAPSSGVATSPAVIGSRAEPPVHSPRDVALVDNPPQQEPTENTQPPDKSGGDKSGSDKSGGDKSTLPTKSAPVKTTASKPIVEMPDKPKLPAVPDKEALAAAEKTIQSIYKSDLDQANHGGPEAKAALAKQWITRGMETTDNPAARYVLLTKARDFAIAAGDVQIASNAVDDLLKLYATDRPEDQILCFTALAKTVRTHTAAESLRIFAGRSSESAISDDNYELAGKYARFAMSLATKLRDPMAASQLKAELAEIEQCKKEYAKLTDELTRLRSDPDDADANLAAGRFYGLAKGDFEKALRYLARSSDSTLKNLAEKDLSGSADPAEQVRIGDGWWALAEANHDAAKSHLQTHAAVWYAKAAPHLKGLAKAEVETRLREADASAQPRLIVADRASLLRILLGDWKIHFNANPDAPKGHLEQLGFDYTQRFNEDGTWSNQITSGTWALDGDTVTCIHNNRKDIIQKYQITGNGLRGESYSPPEVLLCHGTGTKVESGK